MQEFLAQNRADLIERCTAKVAKRQARKATSEQLQNGVPLFIRQLESTLRAEAEGRVQDGNQMSGRAGGVKTTSEIGRSAAAHGEQLLKLGYTIDLVVHDYGDLCQAITELAFEREIPFSVSEFHTLNRCLDNAIADAVAAFANESDAENAKQHDEAENKRLGFLVHELRNHLNSASLALRAIEQGALPITGATGAVLKRSMQGMKDLVKNTIEDVRAQSERAKSHQIHSVADLTSEAKDAAVLVAKAQGCTFSVTDVDPTLKIQVDRSQILAALANVLQNAFKFTLPDTEVVLSAYRKGLKVHIDVRDHCGGLPKGDPENLFDPFTQRGNNKSGVGLGLSIARQAAENADGTLTVQDIPGTGCIFTFTIPLYSLPEQGNALV